MIEKLTEIDGVSGLEDSVREFIISEIAPFCGEIKTDRLGNIYTFKKGKSSERTCMVSAHTDEVGFIVKAVTDEGFIKFSSVGGVDSRILPGLGVKVNGLPGVIGKKAIHLLTKEQRQSPADMHDLYIDIGASTKDEALKYVSPGDYISFDSGFTEFGDGKIKAKALDDRLGCCAVIELIKNSNPYYDTYFCFTVQEEVGCRGALVLARRLKPDYALVLEGTTCGESADTPSHLEVTNLSSGGALSVLEGTSLSDRELIKKTAALAEKRKIPCQLKRAATGGNDAGNIQISGNGVRTMVLSVPCRYIHSPVSVADKKDFENTLKLSKLIVEQIFRD